MDNNIIEQYKANEEELKKQLQEAKAENHRLELEMKYKDKLTGLWNRKYEEMIIAEGQVDGENPNLTVACVDIDNLNLVNENAGVDAGDALFRNIASGMQKSFGLEAICCKLVGTKMCAFFTATQEELDEKIKNLDTFIYSVKVSNDQIDISYGTARHDMHPDKDVNALLKEAEYDLQMHKVNKENSDNAPVVPRKQRQPGDDITILMIDDSMVILRTLQMMLKDDYQILMSTSGMEGYEIAKSKNPDLILLDYNMPVVDGERIMHLLKKSNLTKNIPVVFISGVSDKEKILKVASMNPAGYLLKPVAKDDLLKVVNSVLQSEDGM